MSKSLNILLLTDGIYPFVMGGMQKHSLILSKLLVKKGHKVTLAHCGYVNKTQFNEDYKDVFTPYELKHLTPVFIPFLLNGKLPGHYVKANKTYSNLLFNKFKNNLSDYDLIYAQGFTAYSFLKNKQHIPVWINLHGYEMYQTAPNLKVKLQHFLLRPIVKTLVKKGNYILSFGGQIDNILFHKLNVDPKKIVKQSNGIENSWVKVNQVKNQPVTTVTFIGRYERRKGIEELTDALKKLVEIRQDFKFNFIGPIPVNHQINHSSINYLGSIKDENKIKTALDESDFLINPSYAEGMPTVILEAMARGNAIIATDVGATSKIIDGNGWLIECEPQSIITALIKAINFNKDELLKLKQQSIKLVKEKLIWEDVIDDLIHKIHHYTIIF